MFFVDVFAVVFCLFVCLLLLGFVSEFLLLFLLFVCLLLLLFSLLLFWVGIIHAACTNTLPPSPVTQDRPFRMPEVRKGGGGGGGVKTLVGNPPKETPHHRRVIWVVFTDST